MKIEVNITKRYAFLILGSILILAGVIIAVAQSVAPNPGHVGEEIGITVVEVAGNSPVQKNLQEAINAKNFNSWDLITNMPAGFKDGIDDTKDSCTLVARSDLSQRIIWVDTPDACKGQFCKLMLTATTTAGTRVVSIVDYIEGNPLDATISIGDPWRSTGTNFFIPNAIQSAIAGEFISVSGLIGDNAQQILIMGNLGSGLFDDHRFDWDVGNPERDLRRIRLVLDDSNGIDSKLYLC